MTPDAYERLRNELIALLSRADSLEDLPDEARDHLGKIRRKAMKNQFEIVLAGEFQGGKSTTFNALCDGRELSPTGSGVKTSGTLVTARNLSDPDAPESAQIIWREARDLLAGFSGLLFSHLKSLDPSKWESVSGPDLPSLMNLGRTEDRAMLMAAASMEWEKWKADRSGYDPEHTGLLDILRSASLIIRYSGDKHLEAVRSQSMFSLESARRMAVFPADWEKRWLQADPDAFQPEEALFLFINEIRLFIRSKNLSRLGCVMVDCPGLFASRWDTETARRAMYSADAILYLLDGSKTLKLSDLSALRFIQTNGMGDKLLFGCNMRGHTLSESLRIMEADKAVLRQSGFNAPDSTWVLYHALLGLRVIQAENGPTGPAGDMIEKAVSRHFILLDADDPVYPPLSFENIALARKRSGIDDLMRLVETTVIQKKARSVLIDNGARPALHCLKETDGNLAAREHHAFQKEKEFRRRVAEIETALVRFKGDCAVVISRLEDSGPDYLLAEDAWERLNACQEDLTNNLSDRIYREVTGKFSLSLFNKKKFQEKITAIIQQEIDRRFTTIISAWMGEIQGGRNRLYHDAVTRRVHDIGRDLKRIWEKSSLSEDLYLSGITLPEFSGNLNMDMAAFSEGFGAGHVFDTVRTNAMLAAGGMTGMVTATSGILVAVYMMITRLFWIRIATVVTLLINVILMVLAKGFIEKSMKEEIRRKLAPALILFFHDIKDGVQKEFRRYLKEIRLFYTDAFKGAANLPEAVFIRRKTRAENDLLKSREEREAVARKSAAIREEIIRPLCLALEEFSSRVDLATPPGEYP